MNQWAARTLLVVLAGMIIILGVSGCMSKKKTTEETKPTPEVVKEKVLTHLQEKYGEEFVPVSFSGSSWAYAYNTMYVYPKNGSKSDSVEVHIVINKDGTYDISDGYFGIYIREKYETVISDFVSDFYEDFKLYTDFGEGTLPNRLNKNSGIEQMYVNEDENVSSHTVIFVKEDSVKGQDVESTLVDMAKKMRAKKMVGMLRLYVVKSEKFEGIDLKALNAVDESEYFLGSQKSVMVTHELKIRQNRKEVDVDG